MAHSQIAISYGGGVRVVVLGTVIKGSTLEPKGNGLREFGWYTRVEWHSYKSQCWFEQGEEKQRGFKNRFRRFGMPFRTNKGRPHEADRCRECALSAQRWGQQELNCSRGSAWKHTGLVSNLIDLHMQSATMYGTWLRSFFLLQIGFSSMSHH